MGPSICQNGNLLSDVLTYLVNKCMPDSFRMYLARYETKIPPAKFIVVLLPHGESNESKLSCKTLCRWLRTIGVRVEKAMA